MKTWPNWLTQTQYPSVRHNYNSDISVLNSCLSALKSKLLPSGTSKEEVVQLLARFHSNNFSVMDGLLDNIGAGIYPEGAMFNHSCVHNCVATYEEGNPHMQVLRAIVPVQKGEELTHPYIDLANTTAARQAKLLTTYCFTCACARCEDKSVDSSHWKKLDAALEGPGS